MGNGGFAHTQKDRNITDAHFGPQERAQDFNPGGIAENLKQVRQIQQEFIVGHFSPHRVYHFLMDYVAVKALNVQSDFYHNFSLTVEHMNIYKIYRNSWAVSRIFCIFRSSRERGDRAFC
jgi:hypothetical protein